MAAGIDDGTVQILDLVQGKAFGPPVPGALARFSPDGPQLLVIGTDSGAWLWDLNRIADDTLLVPPLRGQKLSASSSDRTMTAQITERGIALKTQAGQSLLVLPGQGTMRRIAFSAHDQYLIAETAVMIVPIGFTPIF